MSDRLLWTLCFIIAFKFLEVCYLRCSIFLIFSKQCISKMMWENHYLCEMTQTKFLCEFSSGMTWLPLAEQVWGVRWRLLGHLLTAMDFVKHVQYALCNSSKLSIVCKATVLIRDWDAAVEIKRVTTSEFCALRLSYDRQVHKCLCNTRGIWHWNPG